MALFYDPRVYEQLKRIADELRQLRIIARELAEIEEDLDPKLSHGQVDLQMKQIQVGGTSLATLDLKDQFGAAFTIDSTYTVVPVASNPATVSVGTPNADGSFVVTGVAPDTGNQISAQVTRPDGVQVTLTPDTLVIVASQTPVLTSGAVVLT